MSTRVRFVIVDSGRVIARRYVATSPICTFAPVESGGRLVSLVESNVLAMASPGTRKLVELLAVSLRSEIPPGGVPYSVVALVMSIRFV